MPTEFDEMIVRLVGDPTGLEVMLSNAIDSLKETDDQVDKTTEHIKSIGEELKGWASGVIGVLGGLATSHGLMGLYHAYEQQEEAEVGLQAALKVTGQEVDKVFKDFVKFADQIQATTKYGDESTLTMLKQATALGLVGEEAKDAVRWSLGLSQIASNINPQGALRLVAAFKNTGDMAIISRLLRGVRTEAEAIERMEFGFDIAKELGATTSGMMARLKNDWGDFKQLFGGILAEGLEPILEVTRDIVKWLQKMDPAIMHAVLVVGMMTAAFMGLAGAIAVAGKTFNLLFGGIGIITGLIVTGLAAATAATAGLVLYFGGIGETMKRLKDAALEAWEWIRPVRLALLSFFGFIWDTTKKVWSQVKAFILTIWEAITGQVDVNWEQVRDFVVYKILEIQFHLENFGRVASAIWARVKYEAVSAWNDIRRAITGATDVGELEGRLKREFEALQGPLAADFQAFINAKMKEFNERAAPDAEGAGRKTGQSFNKGLEGEISKIDAVLFRSVEAMTRIAAHRERMASMQNMVKGAEKAVQVAKQAPELIPAPSGPVLFDDPDPFGNRPMRRRAAALRDKPKDRWGFPINDNDNKPVTDRLDTMIGLMRDKSGNVVVPAMIEGGAQ